MTDFTGTDNVSFPEAPIDGKQYARSNESWEEVIGFEEAPIDGKQYVRSNSSWVEIEVPDTDGVIHGYVRPDVDYVVGIGTQLLGDNKKVGYQRTNGNDPGVIGSIDVTSWNGSATDVVDRLILLTQGNSGWLYIMCGSKDQEKWDNAESINLEFEYEGVKYIRQLDWNTDQTKAFYKTDIDDPDLTEVVEGMYSKGGYLNVSVLPI
ncbi:hypothetical protein PQC39_gp120 [Vibrio phage Vp_R1]|uniref:Uncharacterized protein n=1 Tax=Vibrio phage Vp_R1 TaxID=2059867 RepID=A0A2H5BQ76_9CAUD|nr:hypothetical protein PQC39_gp120 [Vibrio phage Vp_R1]AUG88484.1 hypothetical protein VPR_120 [Vibrio phage Vp_R1]